MFFSLLNNFKGQKQTSWQYFILVLTILHIVICHISSISLINNIYLSVMPYETKGPTGYIVFQNMPPCPNDLLHLFISIGPFHIFRCMCSILKHPTPNENKLKRRGKICQCYWQLWFSAKKRFQMKNGFNFFLHFLQESALFLRSYLKSIF